MDKSSSICADLPAHLSAFVDAFVDYSVCGLFFLPRNPNSADPSPSPCGVPDRLVAIGDLHGDLNKSKQALRIAGLIDDSNRWIGGNTTVVQIGDVLDRGGEEIKILYFLEKLKREAWRCGGSIITMIGNHEVMNVEGDFRFVTPSGLREFEAWADWFEIGISMKSLCSLEKSNNNIYRGIPLSFPRVKREFQEGFRARVAALRPNGPISRRFLSGNPTALVLGESVFVHGGLLPNHVSYGIQRINREVSDWISGVKGGMVSPPPSFVRGRDSVVWSRKYSDQVCDCSTLQHVLATIPGAKRMIMGHTIQDMGINAACHNQAIRIDVGMSKGCGDRYPEVLEIIANSELHVLTTKPMLLHRHATTNHNQQGLGLLIQDHAPPDVQVQA